MRKFVPLIISLCTFVIAGSAAADSVQQLIHVTIGADSSASGVWTLPVSPADGPFEFDNLSNFGSTGLMNYVVKKAANDYGDIQMQPYGGGYSVQYNVPGTGLRDTTSLRNLYLTYSISSSLSGPAPLYEIWVAGGSYFNQPAITIDFPKGWQLLTSWPEGAVSGQTLTITYPTNTPYVSPALVLFAPSKMPDGQAMVRNGKYTVIGSTGDVQKIVDAVSMLGFVDTLFKSTGGLDPLDSVVIYAADLSKANVGYEATALAAKPNIVLYNKDVLANQSREQIETVLVHEMTHLAEMKMQLFRGATYNAPWFQEGLAVFMENQARASIYGTGSAKAIDDLTGQTHVFSASELQLRETMPFDYSFSGLPASPVWDSYSLSGAVMTNFYNKVGAGGLLKLYSTLKTANSSQLSSDYDSSAILNAMQTISNMSSDQLLFPFKTSAQFARDASALVRQDDTSAKDADVVSYIQSKIPRFYPKDGSSQPTIAPPITTVNASSSSSSACVVISRSLHIGSYGADVKGLQLFLISSNYLAAGLSSGYFGPATSAAVKSWQAVVGISATGTIGPLSRAKLAGCH